MKIKYYCRCGYCNVVGYNTSDKFYKLLCPSCSKKLKKKMLKVS